MWTCTDNSPLRVRTIFPVAPTQSPSDNLEKASNSAVIFAEREQLHLARRVAQGGEGEPSLGAHEHDPARHRDDVVALLPGPERRVAVVQRPRFGASLEGVGDVGHRARRYRVTVGRPATAVRSAWSSVRRRAAARAT